MGWVTDSFSKAAGLWLSNEYEVGYGHACPTETPRTAKLLAAGDDLTLVQATNRDNICSLRQDRTKVRQQAAAD